MGGFKGLKEKKAIDPEEELDMCEESFNIEEMNTADEDIDALVLFGDVDFENKAVVQSRVREWKDLFDGS